MAGQQQQQVLLSIWALSPNSHPVKSRDVLERTHTKLRPAILVCVSICVWNRVLFSADIPMNLINAYQCTESRVMLMYIILLWSLKRGLYNLHPVSSP